MRRATVTPVNELLDYVLTASLVPVPTTSVDDSWQRHLDLADRFPRQIDRAAAAGFGADRLGYAFLSGYQAALHTMLPDVAQAKTISLCATEAGGGRPAAIRTTLRGDGVDRWSLSGTKSFVTLGTRADLLVVIASVGEDASGRNSLRAVTIEKGRAGSQVTDLPVMPFAPEIGHASLELSDVVIGPDDLLPGDAYVNYLKPFRTIEDLHVLAAGCGMLVQVARRSNWPASVVERILVLLTAIQSIAAASPAAASTHAALGGVFGVFTALIDELGDHWAAVDADTWSLWERDRPILGIAGTARSKRREVAWRTLGLAP